MTVKSIYSGQGINAHRLDDGVVEIVFDHKESSVNKFDQTTLNDLQHIVDLLVQDRELRGILVRSAKDAFIVGADVTEFPKHFAATEAQLGEWLRKTHKILSHLEDLKAPSVVAIDGLCLGGGFEFSLAATFRIASENATVGLPETKLGIYPGWGGTVRLPRLIGADNAIEWIASGGSYKADAALKVGAVDAVVASENLRESAYTLLKRAIAGKINWQARQEQKRRPLQLISDVEAAMVFEGAKAFVGGKAGPHYPAPVEAIKVMQQAAGLTRDEAIEIEIKGFVKMAKTKVAENLVTIFLSDQFNKKKTKSLAKQAKPVRHAAVLGAGIMGGGIAYQSASKGVPILMKDINERSLTLGLNEAAKLFDKLVENKKISTLQMAQGMAAITPTLSYGDFGVVDFVVEAVVENEDVKTNVLSELEKQISKDTIITSNTSTISISRLAKSLTRPENFCGMHFFNPVHKMPLVEVIKGEKTSDETVNRAVAFALQLGKTPIVVNDCPGFLVNRILFPYFFGFMNLLEDGVDFRRIDKVMEGFGWPMGPAYLLDVIGLDTAVHAGKVMAKGFPDRMQMGEGSVMTLLVKNQRLGQKTGKGFYSYESDKKGKPKKSVDESVFDILRQVVKKPKEVSDEEIIERMMIPMINESARCLEEKIVDTAVELDLALLYGIGFPPFRGGAFKYVDQWGIADFCKKAASYEGLGASYRPAAILEQYGKEKRTFYKI